MAILNMMLTTNCLSLKLLFQKICPIYVHLCILSVLYQVSMILLDEVIQHPDSSYQEFMRVVMEGVLVHASRSSSQVKRRQPLDTLHTTLHMLNLNVYNQQCQSDKYDFPVIVSAQKPVTISDLEDFQQKVGHFCKKMSK